MSVFEKCVLCFFFLFFVKEAVEFLFDFLSNSLLIMPVCIWESRVSSLLNSSSIKCYLAVSSAKTKKKSKLAELFRAAFILNEVTNIWK